MCATLVVFVHMAYWSIRRHVIAGQLDTLRRYINSMYEDITTQARRNSSSSNQFTILIDMNGYDRKEHGCAGC